MSAGEDSDATRGLPAATDPGSGVSPAAPASIGPYLLVRKLGEGGMGQVWLAQQTAPVRRTVALKLVKAGMGTEQIVARFAAERQALALMEHPAIARVYEAGSTTEQQPFFVMEFVDGAPITEYCDRRRLSIDERIALFIQVCEGVQHAHQKAILHRDLKPSNILVAEQDGKPLPKIIDFGLAKAMQADAEATQFTQVGLVVGTPAYMSPEQAGPQAAGIDTRTDVYSLGVILYELLSGTTPIADPTTLAPDELLRAIREQDAPRPSRRVFKSDGTTLLAVAETRSSRPAALRRVLSGDLDWICLKALEKDRERRYASPADLAADLRRYLGSEPVVARPPSAAYRARKFVRRNRLGAAFAATLVLMLVGFAVVMTLQALRIARERDLAEKKTIEATKQAKLALGTIYEVVKTADERLRDVAGTNPLRKDLLEIATKNLDEIARSAATADWADRTVGVGLQRMGDFYYQMGQTSNQIKAENQALAIFRRLEVEQPGEQWLPWNIAVSLDSLGGIARELDPTPAAALDDFEESLRIREELLRDVHQDPPSLEQRHMAAGTSAAKLADLHLSLGDPQKALGYAQRALQAYQAAGASGASAKQQARDIGYAYFNIGVASLPTLGEAPARQALLRSIELRQQSVSMDPMDARAKIDLANSDTALGDMGNMVGKPAAALEDYGRAVTLSEGLLAQAPGDLETQWFLANALYGMGVALESLDRHQDARARFERCLGLREIGLKSDPLSTQSRTEIMLAQAHLGRDAIAGPIARELHDAAPRHPARLMLVARAYAVLASTTGKPEYAQSAVRTIGEAIDAGWRDRWTLAHEPDLRSLQNDPGFRKLLGE